MKVLLINPNRFRTPPAPPIGLEFLAANLEQSGHSVRILDLCFSEDMNADIDKVTDETKPEIAGITIRNIDSVLFTDNEFYLDSIRQIVRHLKKRYGIRVIIGGAALTADADGLLAYLGADYGIAGPAENVINKVLLQLQRGENTERIIRGYYQTYSPSPRCTTGIDYARYYQEGGIGGFETHKGCSSSCVYCIEANSPVTFKNPQNIVQEIRGFVERGFEHFHLCDPEFNEDLDHSLSFCTALKQSGMTIRWVVYMKPGNFSQKLFRLMKETGVSLITLTVDSFKKCPLYWNDTEKIIFSARSNGIRVAVDFLTGFPYEDEELLKWCLGFFRRLQPDAVNINTHIRLYRNLPITRIINGDPSLSRFLMGNVNDESMIRPLFFNRIDNDQLRQCIAEDKFFRIEGAEKGVNYTRSST
jgi:hypothetical protein